jgi:FlaA1/EpsC-like NDP-sugar epimerase
MLSNKQNNLRNDSRVISNDIVGEVAPFRARVLALPRFAKQLTMITADIFSYAASAFLSFGIVYGTTTLSSSVLALTGIAILIAVPTHWAFGLYASIVRYMGLTLIAVGLRSTLAVTFAVMTVGSFAGVLNAPIRVGIVFWVFSLLLVVGGRFCARMFLSRSNAQREPVIIYGAGRSGAQLISALISGDDYLPVALVDDNAELRNKRIHGLRVHSSNRLEHLVTKMRATGVLLAIPSASRRRRRQVLQRLTEFPVHVQTMPDIRDIVSGKAHVDDIRDVDVEDLLGRNPIPPNPQLMDACIKGKVVMVTGAGGSIGSELCNQILNLRPARLVLFELSEAALYTVERNIRKAVSKKCIDCEIVALLGSVHHEHRVREVMRTFEVKTVYHAAAYKHVPIVEHNVFEGIHNNIFGTLYTARAAIEAGADSFVLISTDKAVNPTNVMGATKRFAELILQALNSHSDATKFSIVRFGNVLESSGSVVPLFKEQISNGGPVTVTHRDIIRYFMTIPEAAQLVIQAGSMARGGDVFVLDMGEPVKILDLANRMINLMGMTVRDAENPEGDIEIEFVGLRPAEKLFEELLIGSDVSGTGHPRIMRADEDFLKMEVVSNLLDRLRRASQDLDYEKARDTLLTAVREYKPENGIDDLLWLRKTATADSSNSDGVIEFPGQPPAS